MHSTILNEFEFKFCKSINIFFLKYGCNFIMLLKYINSITFKIISIFLYIIIITIVILINDISFYFVNVNLCSICGFQISSAIKILKVLGTFSAFSHIRSTLLHPTFLYIFLICNVVTVCVIISINICFPSSISSTST